MRYESRREKEQRLKRQKRSAMIAMVVTFGLVALIAASLWSGKTSLENKKAEYDAQKELLVQQIEQEEQRRDELEEYKKYVRTKKFVEEVAKDKFGLLYPGEIVFKPSE